MTGAEKAHREQVHRELADRDVWIFDLDNTLYSAECDLFPQVRRRMGEFIADRFSLSLEDARILQRKYFHEHGTTLRGLMTVDGIDPKDYLTYVHDVDLGGIGPDQALGEALDGLTGRKLIFTNASTVHAERVLDRLGVRDRFEAIFDVEAARYLPKPNIEPYRSLLERHDVQPERAVMVEDMSQNLEPAHNLGMATVLVKTSFEWGMQGADQDHVHHLVDHLPSWLAGLVD